MKIPAYITNEEVKRVCKKIGIRDWTKLKSPKATTKEAKTILKIVNTQKMPIDLEEFRTGLDVDQQSGPYQDRGPGSTNSRGSRSARLLRRYLARLHQ